MHLQKFTDYLDWIIPNSSIKLLVRFLLLVLNWRNIPFSTRWKRKQFKEKKSNVCECISEQVGDIWIPPKVQISNAGTQTDDNDDDDRIASMDVEENCLSVSTIQAQWPKETDDDNENQDEQATEVEAYFSDRRKTNTLLVPRSSEFTAVSIPSIPVHRTRHVKKNKSYSPQVSLPVVQNVIPPTMKVETLLEDTRTPIPEILYETPAIKTQVTTFFETLHAMEFSPLTMEQLTFRCGPITGAEIQSEIVVGFLEIQVEFLAECQSFTLVYLYKHRTFYFLQKINLKGRREIVVKQWTEEITFVEIQIHDETQKQQSDCHWPPLTWNELAHLTFPKSSIENGIICCIYDQGRGQKLKFRERAALEGKLLMAVKHAVVFLVPAKNANYSKLNQSFRVKTFVAGVVKYWLVPVFINRSSQSITYPKDKTSSFIFREGNNLTLTEFDSNNTDVLDTSNDLKYTLRESISSPKRKPRLGIKERKRHEPKERKRHEPKERKNRESKERNDKIRGQAEKTMCRSDVPIEHWNSGRKYKEMDTPVAATSLSKAAARYQTQNCAFNNEVDFTSGKFKTFSENHKKGKKTRNTNERSRAFKQNPVPKFQSQINAMKPLTYFDSVYFSILSCYFKGAVPWQKLCYFFVSMMLLSPAKAVTDGKCRGIKESARNVSSCPTTKEEMLKGAVLMNCELFSDSCENQLEYHCVRNDLGTGFVEVCSPKIKIVGALCAEYNEGLGGIQPQNQKSCTDICPFAYFSTEMYKYSSVCYVVIRLSDRIDSNMKDPENSTTNFNLTEEEKDSSMSRLYNTTPLQENGTIFKESQDFPSTRCEDCSYNAIIFIAIAILAFGVYVCILYCNRKNYKRVTEVTEMPVIIHNCAAKKREGNLIIQLPGSWTHATNV